MIPRHSGMVSMLLYFGYLLFALRAFTAAATGGAAAAGSTAAGGAAAARANITEMVN